MYSPPGGSKGGELPPREITYRQVSLEDFGFIYRLYRSTMKSYVEETWGTWDETWQQDDFRRAFHPYEMSIIQVEGKDIGVLQVQNRTEEIFLTQIEILPEFQNLGIGTRIIQCLLADASERQKPLALQVLRVNTRARMLYQRMGFGVTGENDTHYIMACELRARNG